MNDLVNNSAPTFLEIAFTTRFNAFLDPVRTCSLGSILSGRAVDDLCPPTAPLSKYCTVVIAALSPARPATPTELPD
jgi:hypothetical protein